MIKTRLYTKVYLCIMLCSALMQEETIFINKKVSQKQAFAKMLLKAQ